MKNEPFKVGDEVAVYRGWSKFPTIQRVARVLKRFVELDDGTQWRPDGWGTYPKHSWDTSSIRHATDEHKEEARRHVLIRTLEETKWEELDTATLDELVARLL